MEENKICYKQLICCWENLKSSIKSGCKFDLDAFEKVFNETYKFFKEYSDGDKVDKAHISLIVSARSFADSDDDEHDFKRRSALVMTERLIDSFISNDRVSDEAVIYILKERKELRLDFSDVSGSVKKLAKVFEDDCLG